MKPVAMLCAKAYENHSDDVENDSTMDRVSRFSCPWFREDILYRVNAIHHPYADLPLVNPAVNLTRRSERFR
jgi:hypothetical protein